MMNCRNCGNEAYHVRTVYEAGEPFDLCNHCGNLDMAATGVPDVYLRRVGQTFENLCDPTGKPYEIQSKRHKKEIMDKLGVQEAAGTVNGARFGSKTWIDGTRDYRRRQFEKDRPALRENYKRYLDRAKGLHK